MFTPTHLLPQHSEQEQEKYQSRWQSEEGRALEEKITEMIREGAGEDFLQSDFENGQLGFLESMWDLKGLQIFSQRFEFPGGDTFEAINFSHAQFYHSQFINAVFSCRIDFARIYNCEFVKCVFVFNGCYGTTFEKCKFIDCEFFEKNSFVNCDFENVEMRNCFIPERIFYDCRFDNATEITNLTAAPVRMVSSGLRLKNENCVGIYKGIEEAFAAGEVTDKAQQYYLKRMQALTRFNAKSISAKSSGYILEFLTGYGVKPIRVFLAMMFVFAVALIVFSLKIAFGDALLLVSGALFTFGANADLLKNLGIGYKITYIVTAFCGMALLALFITVLATKWLRER